MKSHTTKGCEILNSIEDAWDEEYKKVSYVIFRHHHERYDGKGYPDGLKGEDIPIAAQIVSIADVYDAIRINITHNQLAKMVNQIFITKRTRLNSCPGKNSIYNKYNMIYPGQQYNENDERVRLIQDFISFDNICKKYKLDDISIKSLKHFLRVRLNNIENDANEILSIIDSLRGEVS